MSSNGQALESVTGRLLMPYTDAMRALGGIGRTTLFELINGGQLERVNIGRRGFITTRSLTAYVDSLSETADVI